LLGRAARHDRAALSPSGSCSAWHGWSPSVDCTGSEPLPPELPDLDGFEGADARRCTRSLLGIAHDPRLVVREKMTADEDERNRRQVSTGGA
jgi:hypothetical protein